MIYLGYVFLFTAILFGSLFAIYLLLGNISSGANGIQAVLFLIFIHFVRAVFFLISGRNSKSIFWNFISISSFLDKKKKRTEKVNRKPEITMGQKIVILVVSNLSLLILVHMLSIVIYPYKEISKNPIQSIEYTWWIWVIALTVVGVFDFKLLGKPKAKGTF